MIQRSLLRACRQPQLRIYSRLSVPPSRHPSACLTRIPQHTGRLASRWYSDKTGAGTSEAVSEATKPSDNKATSKPQENGETQLSELDKMKTDVEAKSKEIAGLKDQYLRAIADYRNLQERTKREIQAARDFALQGVAKDLLASLDNLEHALTSVPADKLSAPPAPADNVLETLHGDLVNLHRGLQLTETVLLDALKKHGLVRFDPAEAGARFDPNVHEAVFQAPVPGKEDGVVFHTQQKGFMLNGRVIRAPKVGVVKNS